MSTKYKTDLDNEAQARNKLLLQASKAFGGSKSVHDSGIDYVETEEDLPNQKLPPLAYALV